MNTLNDNIALIKANFKAIRDAIRNLTAVPDDTPIADYPDLIMEVKNAVDLISAGRTSYSSFLQGNTTVKKFTIFDTSAGTDFRQFAYQNGTLEELTLNLKNNAKNYYMMCGSATKVKTVTLQDMNLNTAVGTSANYMFSQATSLESVYGLDLTQTISAGSIFANCASLKNITLTGTIPVSISFGASPLLTHDSLMNIINALADVTGGTAQVLTLHATSRATLTMEEIAIATAKNWSIA